MLVLLFVFVEEVDEQRSAYEGGEGAYGQFGRLQDGAGQSVAQEDKKCTAEDGAGDDTTVVGPEDEPQAVRHDKSNEADDAAAGDDKGDHESGEEQEDAFDFLDFDAKAFGCFAASEE